jgi:hypothetical protein
MKHWDVLDEVLGVQVDKGDNGELRCTQPAELAKIQKQFLVSDRYRTCLSPYIPT